MKSELNILMLEDDVNDAELVQHELRQGGLQFRADCVQTRTAFIDALERHAPDIILSDHGLPSFGGFEAMVLAKKKYPDIPFIFVTGLEGKEHETRTRECGATDYVLKSQLSRLAPAITQALRAADHRFTRRQQQAALSESEASLRTLTEGLTDYAICMLDEAGRLASCSTGAERLCGYQADEILGHHVGRLYSDDSVAFGQPTLAMVWAVTLGRFEEEALLLRKDRFPFWAHVIILPLWDEAQQLRGFAFIACELPGQKQDAPR